MPHTYPEPGRSRPVNPLQQQTTDRLERLQELFDTEDKWIQDDLACRADRSNTHPEDPAATCWCLMGGLRQVCNRDDYDDEIRRSCLELLARQLDLPESTLPLGVQLANWNDMPNRVFQDIKDLLTRTLKQASST